MRTILFALIIFFNISPTSNLYAQKSQCAVVSIIDGKSTLIKLDGKKVNSEIYFEIGENREGFWSALKIIGNDTVGGFIDHNGIEKAFMFKNTFNFSEGHAVVQPKNGKYS
ncbi:MAG: WG repeat-containing protein [Saprospiraceae bacterium]|nr:WG repeat-containing protein [Saprospiraceae bacterium]